MKFVTAVLFGTLASSALAAQAPTVCPEIFGNYILIQQSGPARTFEDTCARRLRITNRAYGRKIEGFAVEGNLDPIFEQYKSVSNHPNDTGPIHSSDQTTVLACGGRKTSFEAGWAVIIPVVQSGKIEVKLDRATGELRYRAKGAIYPFEHANLDCVYRKN